MKKIEIYGREGCPFCTKAKALGKILSTKDIEYIYIDYLEKNLTKDDLSHKAGVVVNTVPQIWVDDKHVGGYTDLVKYMKDNKLTNLLD